MCDKQRPVTNSALRSRLYEIIFKADTPAGRWFDIVLIICIVFSVLVVMLDSVSSIHERYSRFLSFSEWFLTILFTVEYILRLYCVRWTGRYARSFFGIVDLLAILPTYLSVFVFGARYLSVVRVLRVLRIFRVLKLGNHTREADLLITALTAARRKIIVFLCAVMTLVVIIGSIIYIIEGPEQGFTSIPKSVYWTIVTLTTVGYGDLAPKTALGQSLAAIVMIMGYSIIAVPTGIVTVEYSQARAARKSPPCPACPDAQNDPEARFCKRCGRAVSRGEQS